ncbi:MAG: ABC transporter ATP-binding protein [Lachnospiraceae bacterium]|nr:ABC transporter ATP-binding protein [Lachnospiraceae bacterium]
MELLRTKNLTKVYQQGKHTVNALTDCNIRIEQGEFVAIMGPSGSGKSTLLHLLGALDKPTDGNVWFDGKDMYSLPAEELARIRRQEIGQVFQDFQLIPIMSAYENIITPVLLDKQKPEKEYVEALAERLQIKDRLHHFPAELSGGQKQRVAIARALLMQPKLILADEPTGNLDKESAEEVLNLFIQAVKEAGSTLIMITHDAAIAERAGRVLRIDNGRVTG